jgi:hypothetical protein
MCTRPLSKLNTIIPPLGHVYSYRSVETDSSFPFILNQDAISLLYTLKNHLGIDDL